MTLTRLMALLLFAGTPLLALACGPGDDEVCRGPDGVLEPGETYGDACNLCTCNDDFSITCEETDDCADCEYEGTGYKVGASWPAGDGCNLCQCESKGNYSCTEVACN